MVVFVVETGLQADIVQGIDEKVQCGVVGILFSLVCAGFGFNGIRWGSQRQHPTSSNASPFNILCIGLHLFGCFHTALLQNTTVLTSLFRSDFKFDFACHVFHTAAKSTTATNCLINWMISLQTGRGNHGRWNWTFMFSKDLIFSGKLMYVLCLLTIWKSKNPIVPLTLQFGCFYQLDVATCNKNFGTLTACNNISNFCLIFSFKNWILPNILFRSPHEKKIKIDLLQDKRKIWLGYPLLFHLTVQSFQFFSLRLTAVKIFGLRLLKIPN